METKARSSLFFLVEGGCGKEGKKFQIPVRKSGGGWDDDPKTWRGDTDLVSPRIGDTPGQPHPLAKLDRGVNGAIPGLFRAPGVLLPGEKKGWNARKIAKFGIKRAGKTDPDWD